MERTVVPNVARLADAFRSLGAPVIHTRCVWLRGDGPTRRGGPVLGLVCTLDSKDAEFLDEVAPQEGDIVLNKTGSSVFDSTNAEHCCATWESRRS